MSDDVEETGHRARQIDRVMSQMGDVAVPEEATAEVDITPDRTKESRTPNFSRMRLEWRPDDAVIMNEIMATIDAVILQTFPDAYAVINDIYDVVRDPQVRDGTGEIVTDHYGFTVWRKGPAGNFLEDWSRLGTREREHLIYRISISLFDWEQRAASLWGDAMFAKAQWEERFAAGFEFLEGKPTVDARTQRGRLVSQEERYFAIFKSILSRKADALVNSLKLINQRLKDGLA